MQFQITTNYAISILSYLYLNSDRLATAVEMSNELGIGYQYFMKIANQLRNAKLIESIQGCRGGFRLARSADDISLYDIVKVIEGDIQIMKCLNDDGYCGIHSVENCQARKIFMSLQNKMIIGLENKKLPDLSDIANKIPEL